MSIYKQRVGFLGDSNIGKSVLFSYLTQRRPGPSPTIATDYADFEVPHSIGGGKTKYLVWDVPGSALDECRVLGCCVRMAMLFVCFDPHKRATWLHVPKWIQEASDRSPYAIIVIIAIFSNQDIDAAEVSNEEIEAYANKHQYLYKSVKLWDKVDCLTKMGELCTYYHKTKNVAPGNVKWDEYMKETVTALKKKKSAQKENPLKVNFNCCRVCRKKNAQ